MKLTGGTRPNPVDRVITYLGRIAVVLSGGLLVLTWRLLDLAGKAGSVDPTAVAAVGAVGAALTFVLGALGAMLVSTKTGPTAEEFAAELDKLNKGLLPPPPAEPAAVNIAEVGGQTVAPGPGGGD
jgi:hypothetical protein